MLLIAELSVSPVTFLPLGRLAAWSHALGAVSMELVDRPRGGALSRLAFRFARGATAVTPALVRGRRAGAVREPVIETDDAAALDVGIEYVGGRVIYPWASTLMTTPCGSRTKKRRTPQGSSTGP